MAPYNDDYYDNGRRGYYPKMYRYNQPSIPQYESFFDPIPLEFLQRNLEKYQEKYDIGYQTALAAKDYYGGIEVADSDIDNKNRLVSHFVDKIDTTVREKYGGDWGRASKDVARMVTDIRMHKFWDTTKILKERQEEARKLKTQYGSEALVFDDLTGRGSIDPETGEVVSPDQFQYDIRQRGNWAENIDKILARIKANRNVEGLTEADYEYLENKSVTELSEEMINKLARNKYVQQAILSENPDIYEAFTRLPKERKKWFGKDFKDNELSLAIESLFKGRGIPMVYRLEDNQFLASREKNFKSNENTLETAFGPQRTMSIDPTGYGRTKKELRDVANRIFDPKTGNLINIGTLEEAVAKAEKFGKEINDPKTRAKIASSEAQARILTVEEYIERAKEDWKERQSLINTYGNIVKDFRKLNPMDAYDKTDEEVFTMAINDIEGKYKKTSNMSVPIMNIDILKGIGQTIGSNLDGTEFYFADGVLASKDWNGRRGIGEKTGLSSVAFENMLKQGEMSLGYDQMKGSIYAEVPVIKNKRTFYKADGSVDWSKTSSDRKVRVYFSPGNDVRLKGIAIAMSGLDRVLKDSKTYSQLPDDITEIFPTIQFDKNKVDHSKDVNYQEVFKMKNEDGEDEWYSLNEIRGQMTAHVNKYLISRYKIKS